ncbi:alpha/beta fold hydrolase [Dyella sp. LX-66]|uniref:UilS family quorum-quenching N-acyl-homoserine lactonase n=1 Tax=unclassified Dyella TaxID=2634549 RepID=UPI001BDFC310|nr:MULTISPECIES: alpha/beta fold hydrolase [unclassified Dyella]MBT2117458.1 alpha/beta fold hydrolase [Dyella sp. LX-1]MBT2138522.1 alpha/beta fold hydrolase [Dyella sp. LX-66]
MQKQTVRIGESPLAATLHLPEQPGPHAAVLLCHGFCGTQPLLLPAFAAAFAQAGYVAVTFDYRGFGESGGERGRLVPSMQIDDILAVLGWLKAHDQVDAQRIGLWGTSLGGGHVMGAAARDAGVRCVVSQLAFADGEEVIAGHMSAEEKQAFLATLAKMEERKQAGKEMFVPVTRVLGDPESKAFFEKHKDHFPDLSIKIPMLTVKEMFHYKPAANAAQVTCPTLVVVAGDDGVNPPAQGTALFEAVGAPTKQLHVQEGAKHYDAYEGPHFEQVVQRQLAWYGQHL